MDKLLGKEPVTTGLTDVLTEVPFLDFYSPKFPMSAGHAARTADAQFQLAPGAWTYQAQSYCLKAGTHGPGRGEGYGYAPLKGPKAPIVQSILRRSVDHPEIGQHAVQHLLWAIIARAKLSEMSREHQATAAKLLTPKELFDLNGGAVGILPESAKAKLMAGLPPALKSIVEAENRIRQMVTQANASFEEVERVAVLPGEPAPDAADRTDLPRERWSYHPDGYFIRFDPHGFNKTNVDIYVPKPYTIVRDRKDRIVLIADDEGRRIDILYTPSTVEGASSMRAYRFDRVRFADASIGEAIVVGEWKKTGWTLVGIPDDSNTVAGETLAMTDISTRLVSSRRRAREFENLVKQVGKRGQKSSPQALVRDLVDLAHLQDALSALPSKKTDKRIAQQLDQVAEAWQYTLQRGVTEPAEQRASLFPPEAPGQSASRASGGTVDVDPSENVGVPGQTGRQRLGQSARCRNECECADNKDVCAALTAAAQISQSALGHTSFLVPAGGAKTPEDFRKFKNQMGPVLDKMAKDFCTMPQIPDMKKTLDSLDPSKSTDVSEKLKIAQIDRILDEMIAQLCGPPPTPPKPQPKKDCPDGTQPATPGDEQAAKQVVDGFRKALEKADEELRFSPASEGVRNRIEQYKKLIDFWGKIKAASCVPGGVLQSLVMVRRDRDDASCNSLCDATFTWMKAMGATSDNARTAFMLTCTRACDKGIR